MFITFSDGYTFHFVKNVNDGKNEIVIIKDGRYYGGMKDINKDWGNHWFKKIKKYHDSNEVNASDGEFLLEYLFLDSCAFHDDYDGYSDTYKDFNNVRPHLTIEEWQRKVNEARNRKP